MAFSVFRDTPILFESYDTCTYMLWIMIISIYRLCKMFERLFEWSEMLVRIQNLIVFHDRPSDFLPIKE